MLYEGYILYPYRQSVKNRQRWTFGGLYPRAFCEAQRSVESPELQVQCLVLGDLQTRVDVSLRFLRLIERKIGQFHRPLVDWNPETIPAFEPVELLKVGNRQFHAWQEASEEKLSSEPVCLADIVRFPLFCRFTFSASVDREPIGNDEGQYFGLIERTRHSLSATLELSVTPAADGCFRLTVRAVNESDLDSSAAMDRDEASLHALAAAHVLIHVRGGEFVSQIDPPAAWRELAADNESIGVWPVLVGEPPDCSSLLAAPIILYDYPQIAPESPTALFDATEIDEILALRIMTLTDAEKESMRAVDARSLQLLNRVESLDARDFLRLHGATRDVERISSQFGPWQTTPEQAMQSVFAHGVLLTPGDRVRLAPRPGADIFDTVLAGKAATIHSIEHDFEGQVHLAVTIDDDPGRDLGEQLQPGHRFFYRLDEVEPLSQGEAGLS